MELLDHDLDGTPLLQKDMASSYEEQNDPIHKTYEENYHKCGQYGLKAGQGMSIFQKRNTIESMQQKDHLQLRS